MKEGLSSDSLFIIKDNKYLSSVSFSMILTSLSGTG